MDADILIWASTQITEAQDRGLASSRTIHFHPHRMLKAIRRPTGGEHYLRCALHSNGSRTLRSEPTSVPKAKEGGIIPLAGKLDRSH